MNNTTWYPISHRFQAMTLVVG